MPGRGPWVLRVGQFITEVAGGRERERASNRPIHQGPYNGAWRVISIMTPRRRQYHDDTYPKDTRRNRKNDPVALSTIESDFRAQNRGKKTPNSKSIQ